MSNWDFKAARLDANGKVEIIDLSDEQKARTGEYIRALEIAKNSVVANPSFSQYFVKEGIGVVGGKMLAAGNIEYGICQALHAEEAAVAAFRSHYGRKANKNVILGILAGNPGNIASPCGNCRDILLEDLGQDFEIVCGAPAGGIAVVTKMSDYLFSDFKRVSITKAPLELVKSAILTIYQGEQLVNDAYSPQQLHPERRYHASIITYSHTFFGARDVMCEYHPIYALRDAIRQARRAKDPFIQTVIVVCEDFGNGAPQVMYKDRQHLLELNVQAELLSGKEDDPPVYLMSYQKETKNIVAIWKTSVKEWIPFVFSPRNFGPEFVEYLTEYFHNQFGESLSSRIR